MSSQSSLVLLNRVLNLKDGVPFVLVIDTLVQSSYYLIEEFVSKNTGNIVFLSFETVNRPHYASEFIDCMDLSSTEIVSKVKEVVKTPETVTPLTKKTLIVVDSLNYLQPEYLTTFVSSIILPSVILLAVYHNDVTRKSTTNGNFPSALRLLHYVASSIFEIEPYFTQIDQEEFDNSINKLKFPIYKEINFPIFKLDFTNRRKSGRALSYKFIINSSTHVYEIVKESEEAAYVEDESLLKDLTTFNLTTNSKQKVAKEQVELPFMAAQDELGSYSGAIVYEFEKDDDYDEEDPYEDPF